jgi:polar amino acid transport system substrate-binding protein
MDTRIPVVLDRAAALDRLGFEEELFDELIGSLIERCDPTLKEMAAALRRGDTKSVEQHAHSLKGAAAMLEANAFALAAQELELAARSGSVEAGWRALEELSAAFADLCRAACPRQGLAS